MKKILVLLLIATLGFVAYSQEKVAKEGVKAEGWDFINFTFAPGVPPAQNIPDVYGVKVGLPMGYAESAFVSGVEFSVLGSMTPYVYGLQSAVLFNDATEVEGVQASFIYNQAKSVKGLQFSVANYAEDAAFQVGIVNIIKNSPLPFMILMNFKF